MTSMTERDILNRMTRVESKLVRGFEELGINVDKEADWLTVDNAARVVYIATMSRSLQVILSDMGREGATYVGNTYLLIHKGEEVGSVVYHPLTFGK
jgi:hypothetical protein